MKTSDEYLQEGIAAYKRGRKQEASRLVRRAVQLNPKSESAWLWLSGFVDSKGQRRTCLKRVLALNPENKMARYGLQKLAAETPVAERPSLPPMSPPPDTSPIGGISLTPKITTTTPLPPNVDDIIVSESNARILKSQQLPKKNRGAIVRLMAFGLLLFVLTWIVIGAALRTGLSLPRFNNLAFSPTQSITPEEERAIFNAVYENIAASNAEDLDRYMASIHTQSRDYQPTRERLEALYQDYDLTATISNIEIANYSLEEARVHFILETRKRNGPDFRDNRITGTFILRPEDGEWKLYDQVVNKIQYFEYIE